MKRVKDKGAEIDYEKIYQAAAPVDFFLKQASTEGKKRCDSEVIRYYEEAMKISFGLDHAYACRKFVSFMLSRNELYRFWSFAVKSDEDIQTLVSNKRLADNAKFSEIYDIALSNNTFLEKQASIKEILLSRMDKRLLKDASSLNLLQENNTTLKRFESLLTVAIKTYEQNLEHSAATRAELERALSFMCKVQLELRNGDELEKYAKYLNERADSNPAFKYDALTYLFHVSFGKDKLDDAESFIKQAITISKGKKFASGADYRHLAKIKIQQKADKRYILNDLWKSVDLNKLGLATPNLYKSSTDALTKDLSLLLKVHLMDKELQRDRAFSKVIKACNEIFRNFTIDKFEDWARLIKNIKSVSYLSSVEKKLSELTEVNFNKKEGLEIMNSITNPEIQDLHNYLCLEAKASDLADNVRDLSIFRGKVKKAIHNVKNRIDENGDLAIKLHLNFK